MWANSIEHCCGVCEIGDFYGKKSTEELEKNLKNTILEHCKDNFEYPSYYDKTDKKSKFCTINFFIATTNAEQMYMHEPLKNLGFKARKFKSRHGDLDVWFWSRRGLPKELSKKYKSWVSDQLQSDGNYK